MPAERKSVLFVDDDADVRKTAELLLKKEKYAFHGAATPEEALSRLVSDPVDVILLDLNFSRAQTSGEEGLACLRDILRQDPHAAVIVVTGHSGLNIAVRALKSGAHDFIMKPWNNERLIKAVESALTRRRPLPVPAVDPSVMVGHSEAILRLKGVLDRCAGLTTAVLIRGEPGTGKTLAATTLHRQSGRHRLINLEAGALTAGDLEDQPNTTLLLENIDRLPPAAGPVLQAWLARAPRLNSRLVSTTTRAGDPGLDKGLSYAISTIDVEIAPLRDRIDDIVEIAEHIIRVICQQHGFGLKALAPDVPALLKTQPWSDNIHALRHTLERAVILLDGDLVTVPALALDTLRDDGAVTAKPKLVESEKVLIEEALQRSHFNVSAAAIELGLTRPALYRRMAKYGL